MLYSAKQPRGLPQCVVLLAVSSAANAIKQAVDVAFDPLFGDLDHDRIARHAQRMQLVDPALIPFAFMLEFERRLVDADLELVVVVAPPTRNRLGRFLEYPFTDLVLRCTIGWK